MPRPAETTPKPPANASCPAVLDRREMAVVLGLVIIGGVLRMALPGRMAVEHFDEGVYASNLWFDADTGYQYPARHLYAPPLMPWLLEWSQILLGPNTWGIMLPGLLVGTFTVGLVWWLVRSCFGQNAGIAALGLCALSDYHILYSRTCLTEPLLCLFLVTGVFGLWAMMTRNDLRWAVFAGLATGLAWCAKYNGWLPLAIGIAGLAAWQLFCREKNVTFTRTCLLLAVSCFIAGLVFLPVWWDLQDEGGYRVVQENHARYLVGLAGWWDSWNRQLANHRYIESATSWLSLGLAVIVTTLLQPSHAERKTNWFWVLISTMLVTSLGVLIGTSSVLGILAVVWFLWKCPIWSRTAEEHPGWDIGYWLVAAWFVGLFLTTPLYTPYPRLSLPWLISAWMGTAAFLGLPEIQQLTRGQWCWQSKPINLVMTGLMAAAAFIAAVILVPSSAPVAWDDRTGLASSAQRIAGRIEAEHRGQAIVYVLAEPAVYYHLRAEQLPLVSPVADLGFVARPMPLPVYLVVGPHAQRNPIFRAEFGQLQSRFELTASETFLPSELVLLNQHAPSKLREPVFQSEQTLLVYQLKSP